MKKHIFLLCGLLLLNGCEQKETTVTNPPAEKKETNTTIVKPATAAPTKTQKTEININASPSP